MEITPTEYCSDCGNLGQIPTCPTCGRAKGGLNLGHLSPEKVTAFVETSGRLGIPPEYIGSEWSPETFWALNGEPKGGAAGSAIGAYISSLTNIHKVFGEGRLPKTSIIVCAPSGLSKATWAFSCMQLAQKHGYSVAPFFDTAEANRLLTVTAQVPDFKSYGKITFEDYILKDVLFLSVAKSYLRAVNAASTILDVLDKRSRKGLVTFITSSVSPNELSIGDRSGNFATTLDQRVSGNSLKFPQLVTYRY